MTKVEQTKTSNKEFRGLTVFELLAILAVIGGSIIWALSFRSGLQSKAQDEVRRARVSTLKEHLRYYVSENGSFPSNEQFDNEDTRKKLFSNFLLDQGEDALQDPKDSKQVINYFSEPEGCAPDTGIPCTKVSVSLTLSNGEDFVKFAIMPGKELEYLQKATDEGDIKTEDLVKSVQPDANSIN